jgi:hypothetical protein
LIALFAVWQRGDREGGTTLEGVFRTQESGEGLVGGDYVDVDSICDLLAQALLIFEGDVGWILFCRKEKGVAVDDALALDGEFFQKESDGHEFVLHAGTQDFGGLTQDARNLVKSGDVVLIVLYGIERHGKR